MQARGEEEQDYRYDPKVLSGLVDEQDWSDVDDKIIDLPQNPVYRLDIANQQTKLYYQRFRYLLEQTPKDQTILNYSHRTVLLCNWLLKYKTNNFYALMIRKDHIFNRIDTIFKNQPSSLIKLISAQLQFVNDLLDDNAKEYHLWTYKKDLLQKHKSVLAQNSQLPQSSSNQTQIYTMQMKFIYEMLFEDSRNYHAWDYKLWIILFFGKVKDDLDHTHSLLFAQEGSQKSSAKQQVLDMLKVQGVQAQQMKVNWKQVNSLWSHRFSLLKNHYLGLDKEMAEKQRQIQVQNVVDFILKETPNKQNQCAWNYLYGLLTFDASPQKNQLEQVISRLFKIKQLSSEEQWIYIITKGDESIANRFELSFLLKVLTQSQLVENGLRIKVTRKYYEKLLQMDPIRQKYYKFCLIKLSESQNKV